VDERQAQTFPWRLQTRPFSVTKPGRYAHYRLVFPGAVNLAEIELLARPAVRCGTTISGDHEGSVTARSGAVCVSPGATVRGSVTVRGGASVYLTGATVTGRVSAQGAGTVVVSGTTVKGAVTISGTTGSASVEGSSFSGSLTVNDNRGPVIAGNDVSGILSCRGNDPAPTDNGLRNTVDGLKSGQCARL
jgi:cytoskeletal protein CcmA (bactofilin family)